MRPGMPSVQQCPDASEWKTFVYRNHVGHALFKRFVTIKPILFRSSYLVLFCGGLHQCTGIFGVSARHSIARNSDFSPNAGEKACSVHGRNMYILSLPSSHTHTYTLMTLFVCQFIDWMIDSRVDCHYYYWYYYVLVLPSTFEWFLFCVSVMRYRKGEKWKSCIALFKLKCFN